MASTSNEAVCDADSRSSNELVLDGEARYHRSRQWGRPAGARDAVSLFYKGPSMNPLLTTPDVLHVRPYNGAEIRRGDVVVFPSPDGDCKVVHRVVSINGEEIRTKGDNNGHPDAWVLRREHIIGRVDWIERGDANIRIYSGATGRVQALVLKVVRLVESCACFLVRPVYNRLSKNRVLKRWFSDWTVRRVIAIARPEGEELQLLVGGRVIGRRPAGRHYWLIRRPFRLFVDDDSLP